MDGLLIPLAIIMILPLYGAYQLFRARKGGKEAGCGEDPPACRESCDIRDKTGRTLRYECGHDDAASYKIDLWGQPMFHKKRGGSRRSCSECLLKEMLAVSIRCGSCGYAIMPGDPVSACVDDPRIGKKEWRTVIDKQLLLCLRVSCDAALGYCGHWTGSGIKPAFPGGCTLAGHVLASAERAAMHITIPSRFEE